MSKVIQSNAERKNEPLIKSDITDIKQKSRQAQTKEINLNLVTKELEDNCSKIDADRPYLCSPTKNGLISLSDNDQLKSMAEAVLEDAILDDNFIEHFNEKVALQYQKIENTALNNHALYEESIGVLDESLSEVTKSMNSVVHYINKTENKNIVQKDITPVDSNELAEHISSATLSLVHFEKASNQAFQAYKTITDSCLDQHVELVTQSETGKKHINALSNLIYFIIDVTKQMNKADCDSLKQMCEFVKNTANMKMAKLQQDIKDSQKKNKILRIFSKIFGAVGQALSLGLSIGTIIAAIPTAGASLAVGPLVCGITVAAITVTDITLNATIDLSPTGWVFQKIISGVSFCVEKTVTELVVLVADRCGASEADLENIKTYLTMALATAITVAAACVVMYKVSGAAFSSASNVVATTGSTAQNIVTTTGSTAQNVVATTGSTAGNIVATTGSAATNIVATTESAAGNVVTSTVTQASNTVLQNTVDNVIIQINNSMQSFLTSCKSSGALMKFIEACCRSMIAVGIGSTVSQGVLINQSYNLQADIKIEETEIQYLPTIQQDLLSALKRNNENTISIYQCLRDILSNRTNTINQSIKYC